MKKISRALECLDRGRPEEAVEILKGVSLSGRAGASARLYRSVARRMMGDAAGADADLTAARRLKPDDATVRWAYAVRCRERGLQRKALAECEAAEKLGGATSELLAMRADIETDLGLVLDSAVTSRRAAELDPRDPGRRLLAARRLNEASFLRGAFLQARAARLAGNRSAAPKLESNLKNFLEASPDAPPEPRAGVDPRLELFAVVGALAAGSGVDTGFEFRTDGDYGKSASRWFGCHRKHDAVRLYREASRQGLSPIGAQRSLLLLGQPYYRRSELLEALGDFAERSKFQEFFESHKPLYRKWRGEVSAQATKSRFGDLFAEYTGQAPTARYDIFLCPLYRRRNPDTLNCVIVPGIESRYRIVSTLGPAARAHGGLGFDYEPLRWSIWHEMGHALTDHWLEDYQGSLEKSRRALTAASARRYGWWGQVVREHVVQGLATRLEAWAEERGKIPGPCSDGAANNPLPYLPRVVSFLEKYDSRRGLYPTLESFYPRLMKSFESLARELPRSSAVVEGRSLRAQRDGLN